MSLADVITLAILVFLAFVVEKSVNKSKKEIKKFESPWKLR